jgi:predicted nucleic-acid-binding protein
LQPQKAVIFVSQYNLIDFVFVLGGLFWRLQEIVAGFVGLN